MRKFFALPLLALALTSVVPCSAGVVTIDPNSYAVGTDLSNAFSGLNMRLLSNNPASPLNYNPLFAPVLVTACVTEPCAPAGEPLSLGGMLFNGDNYEDCYNAMLGGSTEINCGISFNLLELNFTDAIDSISVDSVWTIDGPHLLAYNSAGNLVQSCRTGGPGDPNPAPSSPAGCVTHTVLGGSHGFEGTSTLDLTGLGVTRVVFGGWFGTSTATVLTYSVPEPGTLALMLLGLAGARLASRKRQIKQSVA